MTLRKKTSLSKVKRCDELRGIPLLKAMEILGLYVKIDPDYSPKKNPFSKRFFICVEERNFEIVIVDQKFFDVKARKGGGGSIDLVKHLYSESFIKAFDRLNEVFP